MAAFYIFTCPYCDHLLKQEELVCEIGNPFKTCPKCGKTYLDPYCTEPALRDYRPNTLLQQVRKALIYGLFPGFILVMLVGLVFRPDCPEWLIFVLAIPLSWFAVFTLLLFNRRKLERSRRKRWRASDQRLRDPKYAVRLSLCGYHVPRRYLPSDFSPGQSSPPYRSAIVQKSGDFRKKKSLKPVSPSGTDYY